MNTNESTTNITDIAETLRIVYNLNETQVQQALEFLGDKELTPINVLYSVEKVSERPDDMEIAMNLSIILGEQVSFSHTSGSFQRFTLTDGILITYGLGSYFCEDGVSDWIESGTMAELKSDIAELRKVGA